MNDLLTPADIARLVPVFSLGDALRFAGHAVFCVFFVGTALRRLLRLAPRYRVERAALSGLLGLLVYCFGLWCLFALTHRRSVVQMGVTVLDTVGIILGAMWVFRNGSPAKSSRAKGSPAKGSTQRPSLAGGELFGYLLIALLIVCYLGRTETLFDFDGQRLRLYGAAFTDKTTNLMSCYALEHDVPPDCLRFAGRKFPSHYFPHLYTSVVQPSSRADGNNTMANFWFYVPTLGIMLNGLAILAFGRRVLKSYAAGCFGLVIYGLTFVSPELKPLDVTPALALTAIMALDRFRRTGSTRWAAVAVLFVGAMPCFETFHAALMVAALGLWGGVEFVAAAFARRRNSTNRSTKLPWSALVVPALAGLAAIGSLKMLYLGERAVAPPRVAVDSVFGDSYRNTWEARARDDDSLGHTLATLDRWKRKPKTAEAKPNESKSAEPAAPVAWYKHAAAKVIYTVGVPVYVFCRFVHIASFGVVHLWRRRRTGRLRSSELVVAAAALIGFTVPWLVDVGITADGKWWSSPNLYRPTEFGSLLLALLGCGVVLEFAATIAAWRRPATWFLAAIAGYWLVTTASPHFAQATTYLEVPADQLKALAYLRKNTLYEAITVHPWSDCEIRDSARGDQVAFVYKRHYTLGSNLAGRTMYYEGREDYTFSNGFIEPEEVYRRSRARKKFYSEPDAATIAAVLDFVTSDGRSVDYIVEDAGLPAPEVVRTSWPIVFRSGQVTIRKRPD